MHYYLLTNPKFTCGEKLLNNKRPLHANNPDGGVKGGRVNYPALNPHKNISLDDLIALNLRSVVLGGSPWDPLDFCLGSVQENFGFYFDRQFGQQDEIEVDSDKGEDEIYEEESLSSDEDKENAN